MTCSRRRVWWLAPVLALAGALFVAFAGVGLAAEVKGGTEFQYFSPAPEANDLKVMSVDGRPVQLSELKGKVILLNFWRKDCPHCDREKSLLKNMTQSLNSANVAVLCVNFWDDPAWTKSYAKQKGGAMIYAHQVPDTECLVENKVGKRVMGYYVLNEAREAVYEVPAFPATYVIDKEGKVFAFHLGMAEWTDPAVVGVVAHLASAVPAAAVPLVAEQELPPWVDRLLTNPSGTGKRMDNRPGPAERLGLTP